MPRQKWSPGAGLGQVLPRGRYGPLPEPGDPPTKKRALPVDCPRCDGCGKVDIVELKPGHYEIVTCPVCRGEKLVTPDRAASIRSEMGKSK